MSAASAVTGRRTAPCRLASSSTCFSNSAALARSSLTARSGCISAITRSPELHRIVVQVDDLLALDLDPARRPDDLVLAVRQFGQFLLGVDHPQHLELVRLA